MLRKFKIPFKNRHRGDEGLFLLKFAVYQMLRLSKKNFFIMNKNIYLQS